MGIPTWFFAHTEAAFHFTMRHFEFPARPQPSQQRFDRQGQLSRSLNLLRGDPIEGGLTVRPAWLALANLAGHPFDDNQEEGAFGQPFSHKGSQHLNPHHDGAPPNRPFAVLPGQASRQPFAGWVRARRNLGDALSTGRWGEYSADSSANGQHGACR